MANVKFLLLSKPPNLVQAPGEEFRARASIRTNRLPGADLTQNRLENVDREELEHDLRGYYEAYYSELHRRTSRYPAMHEIFPDLLLGPRRVVAILATDGIVVTHWPAQQQSFEFQPSPVQMVKDITGKERSVQAPSGMWADLFDYDAGSDFGAFELWRIEVIENGVIVKSDWTRVDVASLNNLDSFRDEARARENAERDVQISADAYLMGLGRVTPDQQQENRVISEMEAAIRGLEELVDADPIEGRIQIYLGLKRNQVLLEPSMVPPLRSEVWIGGKKADFVVELPPGERYLLVEIERPRHRLFNKEGRITKEVVHAQQQVEDWMNRIKEHPHEARETLPGVREPHGWVVIGRRSSMTENQQVVLERKNARLQNITIMTYDDLLDKARQHLENLRRLGTWA